MKNLKILFLIPAALMLLPGIQAQEIHSFRATVGGGLHTHVFHNDLFTNALGGGMRVDAQYTYYFHTNIGIEAGLGFDWTNSRVKGDFTIKEDLWDQANNMQRIIIADFHDFDERQSMYSVTIPLAVRGRFYIAKGWTVLPALGMSPRFICGGRQKAKSGTVDISGYYPDWDLLIDPDVPQHGYTTYDVQYNEKAKYRVANLDITADCLFDYQIDNMVGISFGPYFSFSTINVLKPSKVPFVTIQDGGMAPAYSGILCSSIVNRLRPLSFGIRVGVSLRLTEQRYTRSNPWY